jgi:hypothetical protein
VVHRAEIRDSRDDPWTKVVRKSMLFELMDPYDIYIFPLAKRTVLDVRTSESRMPIKTALQSPEYLSFAIDFVLKLYLDVVGVHSVDSSRFLKTLLCALTGVS